MNCDTAKPGVHRATCSCHWQLCDEEIVTFTGEKTLHRLIDASEIHASQKQVQRYAAP